MLLSVCASLYVSVCLFNERESSDMIEHRRNNVLSLHYSVFVYSVKENDTFMVLIGIEELYIIWIYCFFVDNELIRVS